MNRDPSKRDLSATMSVQPPPNLPVSAAKPAADAEHVPPESVGGFRILGVLGAGGMGYVYHAQDPKLGRDVALKVIKAESATETDRQRLLLEARGMAALHHDHIIPVHQVGEHEGIPFLVMPKLEGETLKDRLKRDGPMPIPEVLRIGSQIADGLSAAHEKGLVHRDIKPANIWLEAGTDRVKILDFGLVREVVPTEKGLTVSGMIVGTVSYMSPEQASGGEVGPCSDLFSLGTLLYRMATGDDPFSGDTFFDTLHAIRWDDPKLPSRPDSGIPEPLSNLIMWMLQKDPSDRPESAAQVRSALRRIADEGDTSVLIPKPVAKRTQRSHLIWLVGGIIAVLAVLGGLGVAFWPQGNSSPPTPTNTEQRPPVVKAGKAAPIKGWVDIKVWPREQMEVQPGGKFRLIGRPLMPHEFGALPIEPGDWMRIEVQLTRPAYVYLVWLDSQGTVTPVYPWKDDWSERVPEEKLTRLQIPPDPQIDALPVGEGPSGVEALVLLTRDEPLAKNVDVAGLFANLPAQKELKNPETRAWLENGQTVRDEQDRAAVVKGEGALTDDPVRPFRIALQSEELRKLFPYTRAVCFAYQGK